MKKVIPVRSADHRIGLSNIVSIHHGRGAGYRLPLRVGTGSIKVMYPLPTMYIDFRAVLTLWLVATKIPGSFCLGFRTTLRLVWTCRTHISQAWNSVQRVPTPLR